MDLFGDKSELAYLIPIIVLIALSFFLRRRKPAERTEVDIVGSLFFEVKENLGVVEAIGPRTSFKKLKTGSWKRNSGKVDFLDESLRNNLAQAFSLAEDYNMQVDAAKKFKSTSYLASINIDRLKRSLAASHDGLEGWLRANMDKAGPGTQQRQGCLFGG